MTARKKGPFINENEKKKMYKPVCTTLENVQKGIYYSCMVLLQWEIKNNKNGKRL